MVKLSKVEDRPTPPEVYNWRVYGNAMVATFAATMIGYDSAFIGTSISLPSFKSEFSLTDKPIDEFNLISANIVSMYQAGCFFGAFIGYPLGFFLGRKWGLFISALVFCLGSALQIGASASTGLGIIYGGRIVVGLAIGVASNLAPIYTSEISPPAIRGRLVGLYEMCWQIGGVVGFFINYGVTQHIPPSRKQWLIAFAVQLIPGGLLLIGSLFLIESPRWLASRDRYHSAQMNLAKIRNLPSSAPYIEEEFEEIVRAIEDERRLAAERGSGTFLSPIKEVVASRNLQYRLFLAMSLFAWQNATGINAINYYSPTVFKSLGITGTSTGLLSTGIYGIIKLVGAVLWLLYVVDAWGRRPVLILGSIGGAISMYAIGAYIKIADPTNHPNLTGSIEPGGQAALAFFYLWTIFYSPSWNGTPWVYGSEIFPSRIRTFTQACVAASNWLFAFLIARFTPQMFTAMQYGVYLFFSSLMVLSIPYVYFLVPETKRVPLERMEEIFAADVRAWNANEIVMSRPPPTTTCDQVLVQDGEKDG